MYNLKKRILLDANNYGHTFAMVAGCCWLMGKYNINWSVWLYTENRAFRSCSAGLLSFYSVSLSAKNYGRHGPWEKLLTLIHLVSMNCIK